MADWLDGYERITPTRAGTPPREQAPPCIVLHTVEGDPDDEGSRSAYRNHQWPPQLWVDLDSRLFMQAIPLSLCGYALEHPRGTPETNHRGQTVQVEIEGFASKTHLWPPDKLRVLGEQVLAPIARAVGIAELVPYTNQGEPSASGYGKQAPSRMSAAEWATRVRSDGRHWNVCMHQNVPNNAHWDAGMLDLATACGFGNRVLTGGSKPMAGKLESATSTSPGKIRVAGQSTTGKVRIYVTEPGTTVKVRPTVVQPALDGKFSRYVDVPGGRYDVHVDDGEAGLPGSPIRNVVVGSPAGQTFPNPVEPEPETVSVSVDELGALRALARSLAERVDALID